MSVLERIEKVDIRNLLGKGWLTHDGMWFFHTLSEFGAAKANQLNKAAIQSLAPIEVDRMKGLLGIREEKFENFHDLVQFMNAALELILPDSVQRRFHLTTPGGNLLRWQWEDFQCFAYKGMKQIGAIDGYRCGVMYRIECWLEALHVRYSIEPVIEGCLMHKNGACSGEIRVLSLQE